MTIGYKNYRNYSELFNSVKALAGVNTFTTGETNNIFEFANRRFSEAYNKSLSWFEYLEPSEERFVMPRTYTVKYYTSGSTFVETDFYWVGMHYGTPVYSTIDQSQVDSSGEILIYKDFSTLYYGDWVIAKGYPSVTDEQGSIGASSGRGYNTRDPMSNNITTFVTSTHYAIGFEVSGDNGIINYSKEVPYPHLVKTWYTDYVPFNAPTFTLKDRLIPWSETLSNRIYQYLPLGGDAPNPFQKCDIGEFIRIYKTQALGNKGAQEYDYYVDTEGAHIIGETIGDSVYVTYKKPFEKMLNTSPDGGITGFLDTQRIPSIFFNFMVHTVYADFLRMDGQTEKALLEEETAQDDIAIQLERNDIIVNNNNATRRFSTYVNKQSR
jgi:hypothetical protein